MPGKILLLNGTSSAGKSSIAKKLHERLGLSSMIMSIDDFMRAETMQKAQEFGCTIGAGDFKSWWIDLQVIIEHLPVDDRDTYFRTCLLKFYHEIKQHVLAGKLVIVDKVLECTNDFYDVLGDLPLIMTLVYTPLHKVLKNLMQRNRSKDAYHRRVFASAMRQFYVLYRPPYEDLETDDQVLDIIDIADLQGSCDFLRDEAYWEPEKVERFCRSFMYKFTDDTPKKIAIIPVLDYDCIVNTEKLLLDVCVERLANAC